MVGNFGSTSKTGRTGFAPCGMADGSPPRKTTTAIAAKLAPVKICFPISPPDGCRCHGRPIAFAGLSLNIIQLTLGESVAKQVLACNLLMQSAELHSHPLGVLD